jgi:hypothetical protein
MDRGRVVGAGLLAALWAVSGGLASGGLAWGQAAGLRQVVASGQAAPGGGTFEHFTVETQPVLAPVNRRGQVAFFATLLRSAASEGIFLADRGRLRRIAAEGDPAPGGGALSGFGRHPIPAINESGAVAFAAAVSGGRTVEGIFLASGGRLRTVAVAGEPAIGIPSGTLATLDSPALNDRGDVAFLATVRRGRETLDAIYLRAGGKLRKIVGQGDPAPAGGIFGGFGAPVLNNKGIVAFGAVVEGRGVPGGVFVVERDQPRMVLGAGDATPVGGILFKVSERIALDDAGTIAFSAVLKDAPVERAIFALEGSRLRKIAMIGDPAPGGGTFSHFGLWPSLAGGAVAFTAAVDGGATPVGVFLARPMDALKLAGVGDRLPSGETLASLGLYPVAAVSVKGAVTFSTALTATGEGQEAIYVAEPAGH